MRNPLKKDPATFDKIKAHLQAKWKAPCDCGANDWEATGYVHLILSERIDHTAPNEPTLIALPSAALVCQNCGLTKLLNLKTAGIV